MTRKDYVAIAAALAAHQTAVSRLEVERKLIAQSIAKVMQQDNPRFDHTRFLKACGIAV